MGLFQFWKQGPTLRKRSKDQTPIKDLISYKLKYRTKVGPATRDEPLSASTWEATSLILQSGKYIFVDNSEDTAFVLQGLTYNDKIKLKRYNLK